MLNAVKPSLFLAVVASAGVISLGSLQRLRADEKRSEATAPNDTLTRKNYDHRKEWIENTFRAQLAIAPSGSAAASLGK